MTKQEAIKYLETLSDEVNVEIKIVDYYISSGDVEKLGISRQLLNYHVKLGDIKTIPFGRQKKYLYEDIIKLI